MFPLQGAFQVGQERWGRGLDLGYGHLAVTMRLFPHLSKMARLLPLGPPFPQGPDGLESVAW